MKTTIKAALGDSITVHPSELLDGSVLLSALWQQECKCVTVLLTQDQCGALLFAIEQAAEAAAIAQDRQAAQAIQVQEPQSEAERNAIIANATGQAVQGEVQAIPADRAERYSWAGPCQCGLCAPCPDCGPSLIG